MSASIITKSAFAVYAMGWRLALPLLRFNRRLADGFNQRILKQQPPPADIWIQAASVGESFLAWEIAKQLRPRQPVDILVTTNTSQGMEILEKAAADTLTLTGIRDMRTAYFPFDQPRIMRQAVACIRPQVMVLLESEIWPAHLAALKAAGVPVLLVNARIKEKSLQQYRLWPSLWRRLRPDRILAVSEADAQRFGKLFGPAAIGVMPNIKFDRLKEHQPETERLAEKLATILPVDNPLLVLGSVRQQEEPAVQQIITSVRADHPQAITALFPRHQHRLEAWKSYLSGQRLPWRLRSETEKPAQPGSVILWDTFGELAPSYSLATTAFIGGSLAPLGGQNFLEPLICGVRPVIGPHWETFQWVGSDIFERGLVREVKDWQQAAQILSGDIARPAERKQVREDALQFIRSRQGGTAIVCEQIIRHLQTPEIHSDAKASPA